MDASPEWRTSSRQSEEFSMDSEDCPVGMECDPAGGSPMGMWIVYVCLGCCVLLWMLVMYCIAKYITL